MGEGWTTISIVESSGKTAKTFVGTEIETDTCGAMGEHRGEAQLIFARPGMTPAFYRETIVLGCQRNAPWKQSGSLQRVSMEGNEIVYHRLK